MTAQVTALQDLRAGRLVRPARFSCVALALAAALLPAQPASAATAYEVAEPATGQSISDFYEARGGEPLWFGAGAGDASRMLLDHLNSAEADGLDPERYGVSRIANAIGAAWGGSPERVRRADRMLSEAFVAYVRDLKSKPAAGIYWVDPELKPKAPGAQFLLEAAANAPSLETWVAGMGWMNPIYAGLRNAIVTGRTSGADRQSLRLNLERARALPGGDGRYIIVNASAATLTAYEDGRIVDSMRVVVGKPKNPTPMMAAYIRFTSLNPYWYVPADLAAERIAPHVVKEGLGYLATHGYQVMSDWTDEATMIDPATIDWQAVADGTKQVLIRQLPGPGNSMGQMKFMFPNHQGIYLHDTPQKELLAEASRLFSGGCVRLEDARRLAQWLHGRPISPSSNAPEQRVDLPRPVPVFITYLTVMPEGTELATYPDVYGRDRDGMAMAGGTVTVSR